MRNSVKGIILHQGKILLNKNKNTLSDMFRGIPYGAIYYEFPGGGQHHDEPLEQALIRECLEETGYTVAPKRLAAVYEEISLNEMLRLKFADYAHVVYFLFLCHLTETPVKPVTERDLNMLHAEWVPLEDLQGIFLYPPVIQSSLAEILASDSTLYLGSRQVP